MINTAVYKEFSKGNLAMGNHAFQYIILCSSSLLYFIIWSMENKEVEVDEEEHYIHRG